MLGGAKIIAERAMYFQGSWTAGHGSAGVNGARTAWYFAEGSTGSFFDSFFLLLNSNAQPAAVRGTYRLGSGAVIQRDYFVNANSRFNIWVNTEPGLSDAAFSLELQSIPNGSGQTLPIVAERAMWWPRSPAWYEAHNSPGEAGAGTMWAMSGGEVNLGASEETYVLINNASGFAAAVDVTAILPSGTVTRSYYIPANSRFNVPMSVYFPESNGTRFGVLVRSTNSAQLVVERSVYANGGGVSWTVGANAFGTRLQ